MEREFLTKYGGDDMDFVSFGLLLLFTVLLVMIFIFQQKKIVTIILGGFLFIDGFILMILTSGGTIGGVINIPSIIGLIAFIVPMFVISGYSADFSKAFNIIIFKKQSSYSELKKASASFSFLNKLLFLCSAFITFIGWIAMLNNMEDLSHFGPNFAVSIVTFIYAFILCFILTPFKGIIDRMIIDYVNQE